MDWLLFVFALELGAIRASDIPVDPSMYVQTDVAAIIGDHLEVGSTMRSYQVPENIDNWLPFRIDYSLSAVVRFGGLSFGVEHLCYHPVTPYRAYQFAPVDRWSDRVFVRVETLPSAPHHVSSR